MREADFDRFVKLIELAAAAVDRPAPSPEAIGLRFRLLLRHPIELIERAIHSHLLDPARGNFVPTVADIESAIGSVKKLDGRPGAEEAWAISVVAADEMATVIWTTEMRDAWAEVSTLYRAGDAVAARMAFRECYLRMVEEARAAGRAPEWETSEGHAPARQRAIAAEAASARGLLPVSAAAALLPAPADEGSMEGLVRRAPEAHRARLSAAIDALKAKLATPPPRDMDPGVMATRLAQERLAREVGPAELAGRKGVDHDH